MMARCLVEMAFKVDDVILQLTRTDSRYHARTQTDVGFEPDTMTISESEITLDNGVGWVEADLKKRR